MSLYKNAIQQHSLEGCDAIFEDTLRSKCRDIVILEKALTGGDIELCASIRDTERATYCQSTLQSRSDVTKYQTYIASDDLDGCSTLGTDSMQRQCHDTIIFARVRTAQDVTLCDTLYNTGIIERCRGMVR
jgi:hypothetical protein